MSSRITRCSLPALLGTASARPAAGAAAGRFRRDRRGRRGLQPRRQRRAGGARCLLRRRRRLPRARHGFDHLRAAFDRRLTTCASPAAVTAPRKRHPLLERRRPGRRSRRNPRCASCSRAYAPRARTRARLSPPGALRHACTALRGSATCCCASFEVDVEEAARQARVADRHLSGPPSLRRSAARGAAPRRLDRFRRLRVPRPVLHRLSAGARGRRCAARRSRAAAVAQLRDPAGEGCARHAISSSKPGWRAACCSSHRFITCSISHATSPRSIRPTMRPLPLSVWKPRRMVVSASRSCGCARHSGQRRVDVREHFARLLEIDGEQFRV